MAVDEPTCTIPSAPTDASGTDSSVQPDGDGAPGGVLPAGPALVDREGDEEHLPWEDHARRQATVAAAVSIPPEQVDPDPGQIHAWLTAQVDLDEQWARAATPGRWHIGGWRGAPLDNVHAPEHTPTGYQYGQHVANTNGAPDGFGVPNAGHIVNHNPVRVLADVALKRELLAAHIPDSTWTWCGCGRTAWSCPVLRRLAEVYADRIGYPAVRAGG